MALYSRPKTATLLALLGLALVIGGCGPKEVPPPVMPPPPPEPPPPAPTVTLEASPAFIEQGQSATLNWSSTNATDLQLAPGIGRVSPEGSRSVSPGQSTTYTITASGPGGRAERSVRITVAPPAAPPPAEPTPTIEELFRQNVLDAYFDFDRAEIRSDARQSLAQTAEFLRAHSEVRVVIEGHCDERGSTEYNIGLGARRAEAAKQFLISLGVAPDRMETVSYGKEKPFCTQSNEACWQENRRAHFVLAR